MFVNGYVRKEIFLEYLSDNGAKWDGMIKIDGVTTHFYFSVNYDTKIEIVLPDSIDEIPKGTAKNWIKQLGIRQGLKVA